MIPRIAVILALLLVALGPDRAAAHALEPGYLELQHLGNEEWRVTWRKPQVGGAPMAIEAVLSETCTPRRGPAPAFDGRAFLAGWIASCEGGLAGGEIRIEGLERTRTDVLVRYDLGDGAAPNFRNGDPASSSDTCTDGSLMFSTYNVPSITVRASKSKALA